jgi:hypothetical protein
VSLRLQGGDRQRTKAHRQTLTGWLLKKPRTFEGAGFFYKANLCYNS